MNDEIVAAGAVANAQALAPPSFAGMDWLLVINLFFAALAVMLFSYAGRVVWLAWRESRRLDPAGSAPELTLRIFVLFLWGTTLRAVSDGLSLYGWSPIAQSSGGWATAGRFLDPVGWTLIGIAVVILLLTKSGLLGQLRTPPPFMPIWEGRDTIVRLCVFASAALVLALVPVVFR